MSEGSTSNTYAVERVKAAREQIEKASKPASGTTMSDGDIEQLLLLYRWESVGKIFQEVTGRAGISLRRYILGRTGKPNCSRDLALLSV